MGLDGCNVRHLKMVVALSEQGKIATVAQMFHLSQPTLSRTFAELEKSIGYRLFDRHNRGITLTPAGEIFARHARTIIEDSKRAEYEIIAASRGRRGSCAFGTVMTPASDYVAAALARVFAQDATIDCNVSVESSDVLLEDLVNRRLDFAICRVPQHFSRLVFDYEPLGTETLRLVVGRNHPLSRQKSVTSDDLAEQSWVLQPVGSILRQVVDDFNRSHRIIPASIVSTSSVLLTIMLLRQSDRVGIFASSVAELLDEHRLLTAISVDADISIPAFGLVKLKERELSPSADLVYRSFLELIPKLAPFEPL
jgi:DNA-binding transcriptional LysR family regulator